MKTSLIEVFDNQILTLEDVQVSDFEGLKTCVASNRSFDLMFIKFVLMHEGGNLNGDYFLKDELKSVYPTFVGKPITWEHGQPYIGYITDSRLVTPTAGDKRWYIECAGLVWKARYPQEAEVIQRGSEDGSCKMSMEVYFEDVLFMLGDDESKLYTYEEAPFLDALKGRTYQGQRVYRVLIGCLGGGVGVVKDPADVDALILEVAANKRFGEIEKNVVIDTEQNTAYLTVLDMGGIDLSVSNAHLDDVHITNEEVDEDVDKNEFVPKADFEELQEQCNELKTALEELKDADANKATQLEQVAKEKQDLEKLNDDLRQELEAVKAEYAQYKEQVEHEKAEAAKDALASQRMDDLAQSGVTMSEANAEKWTARLREMNDETYVDFKNLLVESVAAKLDEVETTKESVATAKTDAIASLQGLNLEQKKEPDKVKKYEKLWERVLSEKDFFSE